MKILVTGCGRGGTNLGIELIRAFNHFNTTQEVEDRNLFFKMDNLPKGYATKLATENKNFTIENISQLLELNKDMKILFMKRHPIDVCLSKVLRGRPASQGGDSTIETIAADGTIQHSIKALEYMYKILNFLRENYSDRLIEIKMEDMIENLEGTVTQVSDFIKVDPSAETYKFYELNRNRYQKKRYGNNLVKNVALYKDLENNFEGYFKGRDEQIQKLLLYLSDMLTNLGYKNE